MYAFFVAVKVIYLEGSTFQNIARIFDNYVQYRRRYTECQDQSG